MIGGARVDAVKCKAFLLAVECGSLTEVAERMGYTQPGITRMIYSLEKELGFKLLVRSKRGVVATANGREMIPALREMVRVQRVAEEQGSNISGMLSGVLTIGCYWSVGQQWMPSILARFCDRYPGVNVSLHEGGGRELGRMLEERSVDLCFCAEPGEGVECDWIPVRKDELLAWLPVGHPKAGLAAFPVADVESESFIVTLPGEDTDIDRFFETNHVTPNIRFTTGNDYTAYCMVEAGLGMSLNNRLLSARWGGAVAEVPFDPPQYISLGIAVPSLKDASPAVRKFIELVLEMRESMGHVSLP